MIDIWVIVYYKVKYCLLFAQLTKQHDLFMASAYSSSPIL